MIILILFLQNDNSHNLILSSLAVDTVCFCLVLSHLAFSETLSRFRLAFVELQVARKFFLSAFSLVTCSDVIKDSEWKINREGAEERERKKHHVVSCFSFYIFVNFMVMEGLFFEQKCLFIVIKGTT